MQIHVIFITWEKKKKKKNSSLGLDSVTVTTAAP